VSLRLVVGAATDVGRVRTNNEDGYLIDGDLRLFAVADGMGGHQGGEVASATALDVLRNRFGDEHDLQAAVVDANDAVYERAGEDEALLGMGTTLTAGVLTDDGETLVIAHVGDSRAYLWRDGELTRVTTDHSLVQELVEAGELTKEEAEVHPQRSMITRGIGLEPGVEVDLYPTSIKAGDRFVLSSDGLTDMLREDALAEIVARDTDAPATAQALVDAANEAGGVDNTTVVVVDVVELHPEEAIDAVPVDDPELGEDDDPDATQVVPAVDADDEPEVGDEAAGGDESDDDAASEDEPRHRRRGLFRRRRRR